MFVECVIFFRMSENFEVFTFLFFFQNVVVGSGTKIWLCVELGERASERRNERSVTCASRSQSNTIPKNGHQNDIRKPKSNRTENRKSRSHAPAGDEGEEVSNVGR